MNLESYNVPIYKIPVDPILVSRKRMARRIWDDYSSQRAFFELALRQQHGERKPYAGPLKLLIYFYVKLPHKKHIRAATKFGDYHTSSYMMSHLLEFIEKHGQGLLYPMEQSIAACESWKIYDTNPRIEFCLIPLTKDGEC